MQSLIKKTETKDPKNQLKTAQCCAKVSRNIAGCHD
jgi:hypothetical protein